MPDPTPLQVPIETRPTPEVLDTLFYEFVDPTNDTLRQPYGSEHPNTAAYAGFKLVKEERLGYNSSKRWWANDPVNQDTWNYSIEYSGHANANQIFARRYLYRRDTYAGAGPIAKGTLFTGVYLVRVTDGGQNYEEPPTVTSSGGAGTGATFRAVVNKSGEVTWVLIVTEGTDYTSAPTLAFSGGGGTGATATAYVQPAACYLVEEKASELGADDPRQSLFIAVVRIYEVLPGPWLPFTRYDLLIGPIQGRRRAVLAAAGQVATLTATAKTTYEAREGSSIVSWQIEETNTTGAGTAENPVFPTTTRDYHDPQKGAVQETTQTVVRTGAEVGSSTVAGGVLTDIRYEPINEFLLRKIIETWAVPVTRTDKEAVTQHGGGISTEVRTTSGTQSAPAGGLMILKDESTDLGDGTFLNKVATVTGASWPTLSGTHVDEATGITVFFTKQVVAALTTGGVSGSVYTEIQTLDKWRSISIASVLDPNSLPADETFPITVRHSFPDTLINAQFIVAISGDGNAIDIGLDRIIKEGYSGPCNGTLTVKYLSAADYALWTPPNITQFFPESVSITGAYVSATAAQILTFTIPPTLHDDIDPTDALGGLNTATQIVATTPIELPADGTLILTDIQDETWRFGVHKINLIKVEVQSQT